MTNIIQNKSIEYYSTFSQEHSRPPSKGGNTNALHQHSLTVDGHRYSFLALGSKKWVFKNDTVSFEWNWDATGKYRNIEPGSIITFDSKQEQKIRGNRGFKKDLRTAKTRTPASRREEFS